MMRRASRAGMLIKTSTLGLVLYTTLLVLLYTSWTRHDPHTPGEGFWFNSTSSWGESKSDPDPPAAPVDKQQPDLGDFVPRCFHDIKELAQDLNLTRWRLEIVCNKSDVLAGEREVSREEGPYVMKWTEDLACLERFIESHCYEKASHKVPNVVHYVWFGSHVFKAEGFLSVLSAVRYQQPCAIIFHASEHPYGPHWQVLLSIVPNVILVLRTAPTQIYGRSFGYIQHKSDIVRLEVLSAFGGIYLDSDQLLLQPVESLQSEHFVMSHENDKNLANSMMLSEPRAKFIDLWYEQYKHYNPKRWGYHSTFVPWHLARRNPDLITVVGNRFVNPDLGDIEKVYKTDYNLSSNYGLHLYSRFLKHLPLDVAHVTRWNTSLGQVCRAILYDSPQMLACPQDGGS